MKKILLISFLLAGTVFSFAESRLSLVILLNDNSQIVYSLSEEPKITFTKSDMLVKTNTLDVSYALDNVVRYTYESRDVATDVIDISNESQIVQQRDMLLFENLQKGSNIDVYTASGMLVLHCQTTSSGAYALPIEILLRGVYVVNVNGLTYKMIKR